MDGAALSAPVDLIFRQERSVPFEIEQPVGDARFHFVGGPMGAWRSRAVLSQCSHDRGALRVALRAIEPIRFLYYVLDHGSDDRVAHYGWLRLTRSGVHTLRGAGVVIGPIRTDPESRARGLARYAMQSAMNVMVERGHRIFYISAASSNLASLRVIEQCGFGPPAATRRAAIPDSGPANRAPA